MKSWGAFSSTILANQPMPVQARVFQNSRCAQTGLPLELPAVHFLCGHSFNRSALGDFERECPLCADEFRQISDIRRALLAGASEQVSFSQLELVWHHVCTVLEHRHI